MQRLFFYFISLFIIFFACTQQNQESNKEDDLSSTEVSTTNTINVSDTTISSSTPDAPTSPPVPKKIRPIDPERVPKPVPQAPKEDLVYPKAFKEFEIPKFNGATITNNIILENSKGKFGQRLMMDCPGKLAEIFDFYDQSLQSNGWERIPSMDREKEDNDFQYRSALYQKDGHNFSISLMDVKKGTVAVNQILKEV
jgi:hypothetical protein